MTTGSYSAVDITPCRLVLLLQVPPSRKLILGRDSSVGKATRYGLDRLGGSNPGGGENFRTRLDRLWGPHSFLYDGYRVCFPGVSLPRHNVDHSPHLAPRIKKK